MIDRDHLDQAGLAAVGLLEEADHADFEHECLVNPELRVIRMEACDLVAAVAATLPQSAPPPQALVEIFARISSNEAAARASMPRPASLRSVTRAVPWAVAAGFAIVAAWMGWRSHQTLAESRKQIESGRAQPGKTSPGLADASQAQGSQPQEQARPRPMPDAGPARRSTVPSRYFTNHPPDPELRLQQDKDRLRTEVARLRAAENARQQLPSGISDLRVVKMLPPGAKRSPATNDLLTTVTEALAAGFNAPAPATTDPGSAGTPAPAEPLRLRGQGAHPTQDIVIDGGLVNISALNLHPDAQVVHKNFPSPEEYSRLGLVPLDPQTVYDGQGGLWHRSADGTQWIGQKVPSNWTPPEPGDDVQGAAPPLRPAPAPVETPPAARSTPTPDTSAEAPMPYALPILDHQGHGMFIVQNLPPAPTGEFYHLWMMDPRFSGPVSVGVLPPMETTYDHFGFDLGTPGFVPTGYLLTLEKAGVVDAPAGKTVLQGP
jgi:Anti-sigma-K factor rskA, C-terminal